MLCSRARRCKLTAKQCKSAYPRWLVTHCVLFLSPMCAGNACDWQSSMVLNESSEGLSLGPLQQSPLPSRNHIN